MKKRNEWDNIRNGHTEKKCNVSVERENQELSPQLIEQLKRPKLSQIFSFYLVYFCAHVFGIKKFTLFNFILLHSDVPHFSLSSIFCCYTASEFLTKFSFSSCCYYFCHFNFLERYLTQLLVIYIWFCRMSHTHTHDAIETEQENLYMHARN